MIGKIELPTWGCAALALAVAATVAAAAPRPAQAQAQTQTQTEEQTQTTGRPPSYLVVRAYYLWDSFSSHTSESAFGVDTFTTVTYHGKPGGGVDLEYLPTPWLGIDFAVSQTRVQADEVTRTLPGPPFERKANIQVRPFTVGVFAHPFQWERANLYIGPLVGVTSLSGGFRPSATRFAYGSELGIDLPLGSSGLAITGLGRIVTNRFDQTLRNAAHYRNNYLFGGGLAYRW
jgi:hypothetical protein